MEKIEFENRLGLYLEDFSYKNIARLNSKHGRRYEACKQNKSYSH